MAVGDCLSEHGSNGVCQRLRRRTGRPGRGRQRRRAPFRRQPRDVKGFAHVNVAETRDNTLIRKRRLETGLLALQCASQSRGVETGLERLRPERPQCGIGLAAPAPTIDITPNRRGSLKTTVAPDDIVKST